METSQSSVLSRLRVTRETLGKAGKWHTHASRTTHSPVLHWLLMHACAHAGLRQLLQCSKALHAWPARSRISSWEYRLMRSCMEGPATSSQSLCRGSSTHLRKGIWQQQWQGATWAISCRSGGRMHAVACCKACLWPCRRQLLIQSRQPTRPEAGPA